MSPSENMTPTEIAASYDEIAHRWQDETFDNTNGIAAHQRALAFISNPGAALDAGCGCNGRFFDLLENCGFTVEGVDISSAMIERASQSHPHITLHHADICTWQPPRQYSFISAWDSIWHVQLESQADVITKLMSALLPNGVLIFTMGGLHYEDEVFDNAMGVPMYHSTLGLKKTLSLIADNDCICRHLEYDQFPEPHVYVIVQATAEKDRK